jgi:phage shock protein A
MAEREHEVANLRSEVRMLRQEVESLKHAMHHALGKIETLSLKMQLVLLRRKKEQADEP